MNNYLSLKSWSVSLLIFLFKWTWRWNYWLMFKSVINQNWRNNNDSTDDNGLNREALLEWNKASTSMWRVLWLFKEKCLHLQMTEPRTKKQLELYITERKKLSIVLKSQWSLQSPKTLVSLAPTGTNYRRDEDRFKRIYQHYKLWSSWNQWVSQGRLWWLLHYLLVYPCLRYTQMMLNLDKFSADFHMSWQKQTTNK